MKLIQEKQWRASFSIITIVSIISSILLLLASYFYANNAFPIIDDIDHYSKLEYARRNILPDSISEKDNVMYVNVSYDKALVECKDEFNMPLGNITITDRRKLTRLLESLEGTDYKYIFLDVRFEEGDEDHNFYVENDSTSGTVDERLTQIISRTPRLIIASPHSRKFLNDTIKKKSALSEYSSTITATNFVRYPFWGPEDEHSVPYVMYKELCKGEIKKYGPFYFDNGRLCNISPFLQIKHTFDEYDSENIRQYLNLGTEILDYNIDMQEYVKGKIVIIGDFVNDVHDTYVGPLPGSYLSYLAYKSLKDGHHIVNHWSCLIMGTIYFIICVFAFSKKNIIHMIPFLKNHTTRFLRLIITFLGNAFVLTLTSSIVYFVNGETFTLWFPTIYFTLLQTFVTYKEL